MKSYIFTKEQFVEFQGNWKSTRTHTAAQHILYNVLRGLDPKRGFTRILETNSSKIDSNNQDPWNGYNKALALLHYMQDPWNGYNQALALLHSTSKKSPDSSEHFLRRQASLIEKFEADYNIKLTDDLIAKLDSLEKAE
jgi:hypothetical protein